MKTPPVAAIALCTALAVPAAHAATLTVNAGGDLQAALDGAKPGDTIVLQAGATFTGNYKLPAKGGTSFITIRSSASDSQLPPAGTRIGPSYAALLPKIRSDQNGAAIRTSSGASYWRFQFIEFRPAVSNASANLIEFGSDSQTTLSSVPQHLVIDRCYLHGDASYGQRRGVALNSGDTQILNSYFSDFKQANQDTQAIAGWNGPGPYLIENNYIEAAAENIMFGGSDPKIPNLVPSNITIRRNTISKPLAWKTQSWTIKNLIEFKNAKSILIEGNIIENNWMAGQQGYSVLFDVRDQSGTAPWSVVRDVVFQNNIVRHVAAVFNIMGWDDLHTSQQTQNIKIRNNLMYDVSKSYTNSSTAAPGRLAIIGAQPADITFDHNTVDNNGSSTIFIYGGYSATGSTAIAGFVVTNNLLRDNSYAIYGDKYGEGTVGLSHYTPGAVVLANAFGGGSSKLYPAGNLFPSMSQWLADFVSESSANYQLVASSLANNAGTDGKDLGVDFGELNAALNGSATPPPPPPPPPPSSSGSTPYTGTPAAVPGTIQFENYDNGGEGVAYHDTTSGNSGGAYRSNNVDIQGTTDSGGGYNVGWVKAGEWLKYTVKVAQAGSYTIGVRVASSGSGGTFHVEANGTNVTGPLSVPNTGGWQTWKTITKTGVTLAAGQQVLEVVMDANGANGSMGNFNWLAITSSPTSTAATGGSSPHGGTAAALPGTVQAENYDDGGEGVAYHDTTSGNSGGAYRRDNVDIQATTDSGGGYNVGWVKSGEWMNYSVKVAQQGVYSVDVRVASSGSGGTFHVEANGVDVTGPMTVPNTGGWQTWKTASKTGVSLAAGAQVLRLVMDSNGGSGSVGNFNWIRVY